MRRTPPNRPGRPGCATVLAAVAVAGLVLAAAPAAAGAAPTVGSPPIGTSFLPSGAPVPTPPTAEQLAATAADLEVTTLTGRISAESAAIALLGDTVSAADEKYRTQLPVLAAAQATVAAAQLDAVAAEATYQKSRVQSARVDVELFKTMLAGDVVNVGTLLAATDPEEALGALAMHRTVVDRQAAVVSATAQALAARTAAQTASAQAAADVVSTTAALQAAATTAHDALAQAETLRAQLDTDLTAARQRQSSAAAALALGLGGWAQLDPTQDVALQALYRQQAAAAAAVPAAPATGAWSAAVGQTAAGRALSQLGVPYSWAGGGRNGPSLGVCVAGAAAGDCAIVGFDCSGLAMFAWAPYAGMDHSAAAQYRKTGHLHPALTQLLPGDLVFWSSNATESGIHHVAIYVGGGNVVQAPQSGDIVRVTPLASVDSGYFGATRPLS